jgi:tetratricopeptide (TPR) repeat protein
MSRGRWAARVAWILAIHAIAGGAAFAEPFVPASDELVLERLPLAATPLARELRALRAEHERAPDDVATATRLARRYIEAGRAESDPRYYGWAEGVLQRWSNDPEPPAPVLLLRATLRQNRHEFTAALADLDALLARDPRNAQAWLTRAVVSQVTGRPAEARRSCLPLLRLADPLAAVTCLGNAESVLGRGAESYELVRRALETNAAAPVAQRVWSTTCLAEIAVRLGRFDDADEAFRAALALDARDAYLLAARADFLLDRDRPAEVVALLAGETRVDGLLLRLVLAEQRLASDAFAAHRDELRARFAASRQRGDALHLGEEARFALQVLGDPAEALRLAQANWALQREPRDARVLLEAALAARDRDAAAPVLQWLGETALEDARLAALAARLGAPS